MDERDLLRLLAAALADGRVSVRLDVKRLRNIDSPIFVEADSNRWLYGIMAATLGLGLGLSWLAGIGALALGVGSYFAVGRPWIRGRMVARFHEQALTDIAAFKKLWRLHGVTLALAARPVLCRSPAGDWRRFVLDHLAEAPVTVAGD
ncbi:MAG: hypothetical protein R3229_09675 [Alphaproteobacteria bacterium]|nr:hypothetical protein [Alphaproteobacteria bacterium]